MARRLGSLVVFAVLATATVARAHPLDLGYLRVEPRGDEVAVTLDLDVRAAAILLGRDDVDAAAVSASAGALADASYARAPIKTGRGPCRWGAATAELTSRTVKVSSTAICAGPGARTWTFPFVHDRRISSAFELLVKQTVDGAERLTLVDASTDAIVLGGTGARAGVGVTDFVWSGVEHIGVAPGEWRAPDGGLQLPDGIDHILFLIGLMLGGGSLLRLVGTATGFTVGHSITLAIAALGVVHPPPSVIEPLIALSIALVAVEAFWGRLEPHRWKIATGFGLIHGFGFANALTELDLSTRDLVAALFGYNLGVELGQLVVVLVVAPLVLIAHRDQRVGRHVVKALAAGIFMLGLYWFFQRL